MADMEPWDRCYVILVDDINVVYLLGVLILLLLVTTTTSFCFSLVHNTLSHHAVVLFIHKHNV